MHLLGLVLALALLLAVALITFLTSRQYTQWADQARQTHVTLVNLKTLLIELQRAESSERGFLLSGDRRFLSEYIKSVRQIEAAAPNWDRTPVSDAGYSLSKARLAALLADRLSLLRQDVDSRISGASSSQQSQAATVLGRDLMMQISALEGRLEGIQESALRLNSTRARHYANLSQLVAILGCCGVFALLLLSTVRIHGLMFSQSHLADELAESEEEFRRLADCLPQIVWRATASGDLEYVNAVWRDFSGNAAVGAWRDFLHPEDRGRFLEQWRRALQLALPFASQCRMRDPSGKFKWFLFRTTPIHDSSSDYVRWYCTFTDIDEQKNTERALKHANEELSQFAYAAAHDLQEPLRNVASLLGLLRRHHRDQLTDTAGEWVDETVENAKRMHDMIKDLLAYTRALETREELYQMNSDQSLVAAMASLGELIEKTGARIQFGSLPRLKVRPAHLEQLFQNILSNGIKFRKEDQTPEIQITTDLRGHEWVFSISDNGIGFDPAYAERIFGVFKRLHGHDEYPGTGMGLAICYRIVNHYGGRIWAESKPGQGATFRFTLPAFLEEKIPVG